MVFLKGQRGVTPCVVRDIHSAGAGVRLLDVYIIQLDFDLSFDGFRTIRKCHVEWVDGYTCGVTFEKPKQLADA